MTALQDRLTRAKDMALKILQDTVYQMVERIPECSNTAVQGAQLEGYIGFQKMRNGVFNSCTYNWRLKFTFYAQFGVGPWQWTNTVGIW